MLPAPERNEGECYRLALGRNRSTFRCWYALDVDGGVVLRARLLNEEITPRVLDSVLGEMYEQVELTFRPLLRLAFDRG